VTTRGDSVFTSISVSLSFSEDQITDIITLGLEDEVEHQVQQTKKDTYITRYPGTYLERKEMLEYCWNQENNGF